MARWSGLGEILIVPPHRWEAIVFRASLVVALQEGRAAEPTLG
jgi:hypothetical protein